MVLGMEDPNFSPDNNNKSGTVFIRVAVTELKVQKCLQFQLEDTVWQSKQRILTAFSKDLRDALNYGLYLPPANGRAGKFMEEERRLSDYPLQGPIGFLEFKYKRRVYKMMLINERKLKQMHTKSKLKLFLEGVRTGNEERINKMCLKGLDPNFHDQDNGETPLTIAVTLGKGKCREVLISLVSGGAHLDFRNRQGFTPLHRAAIHGNAEAIRTLLDLGASPDSKDSRDITPLYYSVSNDDRKQECTHLLLHERSRVGICDEHGWYEVHQACKYGRVQHLEHLLFYGAEMDVRNSCGNTPLHVSCLNNQEACTRVLLFRGADPTLLNYNNQSPDQVATIAGNMTLADAIKAHNPDDVVPYKEIPQYSSRRKTQSLTPSLRALIRCRSDPRLNISWDSNSSSAASPLHGNGSGTLGRRGQQHNGEGFGGVRWAPGTPNGRGPGVPTHHRNNSEYNSDSACSVSISSYGSGPGTGHALISYQSWGRRRVTRFSCTQFGFELMHTSSKLYVCTRHYRARIPGELSLREGDLVEVTGVSDMGQYEGRKVGGHPGVFPDGYVTQARMYRAGSVGDIQQGARKTIERNTLATLVNVDR